MHQAWYYFYTYRYSIAIKDVFVDLFESVTCVNVFTLADIFETKRQIRNIQRKMKIPCGK